MSLYDFEITHQMKFKEHFTYQLQVVIHSKPLCFFNNKISLTALTSRILKFVDYNLQGNHRIKPSYIISLIMSKNKNSQ